MSFHGGEGNLRDQVVRAGAIIIFLSVIDKVLAVLKEVLTARRFGVAAELDVFNIAFAVPGITLLLCSGALVSAFVPTFIEWRERLSREEAYARTLALFWCYSIIFILLAAAGILFAPLYFPLIGYGFEESQLALGVTIQRWLILNILLEGPPIILVGVLYAEKRFFMLYAAPLCINASLIGWLFWGSHAGIYALVWGTLTGTALKVLLVLAALRHGGFKLCHSPSPGSLGIVRGFTLLALPLMGSELIANCNLLIDQVMATDLSRGSVSTLRYAFRINELPVQVVVMALSRAIFPFISEEALAGNYTRLQDIFKRCVVFLGFLTFPITCLVALFGEEIVSILLQRGAFDTAATRETAGTLMFYSLGLFFGAYNFINGTFFSALKNTRPLFAMGCLSIGLNIGLNMILMNFFGVRGIALATTLTFSVTTFGFIVLLKKRLAIERFRDLLRSLIRLLAAALCMFLLGAVLRDQALFYGVHRLFYFPLISLLCLAVYVGLVYTLRTAELASCFDILFGWRRLIRGFR